MAASFSFIAPAKAQVSVLTQHNDIARTGQNTSETILTPANVGGGNFGKLFSVPVDGQVYAQPLYVYQLGIPGAGTHNVVFTATMHDSVYAFDADTGASLWQITLLDAAHGASPGATTDPVSDTGCTELDATEFGITSTPVIDPVQGVIYVVGKTFENNYPVQRLHALSLTTGAEMPNSPVTLTASVNGTGLGSVNGVLKFDPKYENQRAGLLLVNGIVYIAFASYCDFGPFHGWILAYNGTSMKQTSAFTPTPNSQASGIWMSNSGLAADIPSGSPYGRMFVATGNGTYDATTPYGTNTMDYGVDVLRLDLTNGVMKVTDAFTPLDQASMNANDQDLASGGIMLLPDQSLAGHTHQLLAAGKTGRIYLVDRDNLGGYSTTANNIIEYINPNQIGSVFGAPTYWNNTVFYWGDSDNLTQFDFTGGLMNRWHSESSPENLTFPGSTPAVSSNGSSNGIVWAVDASAADAGGGNARLLAYDATNVSTRLYSSSNDLTRDNPGPAVKFQVPTIANGKVYVGAYGQLSVFGLLNPNFTISAVPTSVSMKQGASATSTITVTELSGFSGNITLSDSGLPSGMTLSFAPTSTSGVVTATFAAASTTAAGSYPIVITGTSGSLVHSVTVTATVVSTTSPSFTLTASPSSISLVQGKTATSKITVVPANGFNSAVNLSASGLPAGVTATFGTASGGASVMTVSASTTATPQKFSLTVTGTSGSLTATTIVTVTVTAQPAFTLSAPSSVNVSQGGSATATVTINPTGGFSGSVTFSASGLPTGLSASFNPASSTSGTTVTFSAGAASVIHTGTNAIVISGVSGTITTSATINVNVVAASGGVTLVNLSSAYNYYAAFTNGTPVTNGGFDLSGNAYSATLLGSSVTWNSITFPIGPANGPSAVGGTTVPLPAGSYKTLYLLAASSFGARSGTLVVTYSDGTTTTINQTFSDWWQKVPPATQSGESVAIAMPYYENGPYPTPQNNITFDIYGYSIALNSAKTVASLTLPSDVHIKMLAAALSSSASTQATAVNMSAVDNLYAIANNGTQVGGIGNDGWAYSANLLGASVTWQGQTLNIGSAGAPSAVTSKTIPLPTGNFSALSFLGTGIYGAQSNQQFTVTYTDGTTSTLTQSLSDWGGPQNFPGESIAASTAYRVTPTGSTQNGPWNLYGYSIALNKAKTVQSLTLPNNTNVVVLAATLVP